MIAQVQRPDLDGWEADEKTKRSLTNLDALTTAYIEEIDEKERTQNGLKGLIEREGITIEQLREYLCGMELQTL